MVLGNRNRIFILFLTLMSTISLIWAACSTSQSGSTNYAFLAPQGKYTTYAGQPITPPLAFTAVLVQTHPTPYSGLSDSVKLNMYTDSQCKNEGTGTLTASPNPTPLHSGIGIFLVSSYAWSTPVEGTVYAGGKLTKSGLSVCGPAIPVLQHFVEGTGYLSFGVPGAAGASTAALVDDIGVVHKIDSTGRYVVVGISKNASGGQELAIWRYYPNGSLDTSFSTNGYIHSGSPGVAGATGASEVETVSDFQIDSSGNYLVVGSSVNASGGTEMAMWRYTSSGTLDTTFGSSGTFHFGSPGVSGMVAAASVNDVAKAVQIDSNSKIIVTGTSENPNNGNEFFLLRFTSTGSLDTTFATNGVYVGGTTGVAGATGASENDVGQALQVDSKGNYVATGSSTYSGGGTELVIWRLNSSGSLDISFGQSGVVLFGTTGAAQGTGGNLADQGKSLRIDSKGNLVIAGSSKNTGGGTELALWRYTSSGTLDTSFSSVGYIHSGTTGAAGATSSSEIDIGNSLVVDNTNQFYIVGGSSVDASGGTQAVIWRYNTSGTLDSNFNTNGIVMTPSTGACGGMTASTVNDVAYFLQLDAMGTYTIVGSSLNSSGGKELAIWRYLSNGNIDQ